MDESQDDFLRRARLSTSLVQNARRVPLPHVHELWDIAARHREGLPALLGTTVPLEQLGPFGFAVLTAPTALAGLEFAARTFPWLNDSVAWQLEAGRALRLRMSSAPPVSLGEAATHEEVVAHFAAGGRRLSGRAPLVVRFAHRRPNYARALQSHLDCPVEFDARSSEVEFQREPFDAPAPFANTATHDLLVQYFLGESPASVSGRSPAQTALLRVRAALARGRAWDTRSLSDTCGISERSLRRYLAEEGTSLRELRDSVRAARALELVATTRSILDIALELGFEDATAFARAFRRWHGRSPREARAAQRPD